MKHTATRAVDRRVRTSKGTPEQLDAAAAAVGDQAELLCRMVTVERDRHDWGAGYNDGRIADIYWLARAAARYAIQAEKLRGGVQ